MDLTAVGTILATGLVTLGSVWLKGRYDQKAEQGRLEAERATAREQLERQERQLLATWNREDTAAAARSDDDKAAESRRIGENVLHVMTGLLEEIGPWNDETPAERVDALWNREHDAKARQVAEHVEDSAIRAEMLMILDALSDFSTYAQVHQLTSMGGWNAKVLVRLLMQLAGCAARREEPSDDLRARLLQVRTRVQALEAFYNDASTAF